MSIWTEASHRRPLIVAHRGASATTPENTLAAFHQAILDGADAIEFDVRLTKDDEVVVIHDRTLHRTTDGSGFVNEKTLSELKSLTAGAWFGKQFASETIPTLDEVFEEVRGRVGINIEMKAHKDEQRQLMLVDRCCQIIKRHRAENIVLLSSFHKRLIKKAKQLNCNIAAGLLFHRFQLLGRSPVRTAHRMGVEFIILGGTSLRKSIVRKSHEQEIQIGEYTINTSPRVHRALRFGVDAIFTDDPAFILHQLRFPQK
ncbi:MAG: hypothetical protein HY707_00150 [Ignavibacteriae bacterium]|nr:hypothetical protein [Ignavibacteriota bacterium]